MGGRACDGVAGLQLVYREWGNTDNSSASGVAFDSAGNIYVSASIAARLTATQVNPAHSGVLTKWSPTLELAWVRQLPLEESAERRARPRPPSFSPSGTPTLTLSSAP